jgi:hypothetical protein
MSSPLLLTPGHSLVRCPHCSTRLNSWLVPGHEWERHLAWHPLIEAYNDAAEANDAEPTEHGVHAEAAAFDALYEWVDRNHLTGHPAYDYR